MYVCTVCHQTLELEKSGLLGLPIVRVGVGSVNVVVAWVQHPRHHLGNLDHQVVVTL